MYVWWSQNEILKYLDKQQNNKNSNNNKQLNT